MQRTAVTRSSQVNGSRNALARPCRTTPRIRAVLATPPQQQQQQQQPSATTSSSSNNSPVASVLGATLVALGVTLASPALSAHAAAPSTLADVTRELFSFLDDKDGVMSRDDLKRVVREISSEENLPLIDDERIDFTMRLFDLNGDSVLTTEELLRSMAIDTSVTEDAINQDVVEVFDTNRNGTIDKQEFRKGLGDLGQNGDAAKDFLFDRVDRTSQSNGQLGISEFGSALQLARAMILGY